MKRLIPNLLVLLSIFVYSSCSESTLDYNNPDVKLFVKQLKAGTYDTTNNFGLVEVPLFTRKDIPELLKYSDDLTEIPSFPLPSISSYFGGKARLGECILWIVESIRLGRYASLGCKLVYVEADNYEGIYFLTNEEVHDASTHYNNWWKKVENVPEYLSIDPYTFDPLEGSNYCWW
ncbi:hypothetical protein EZS27_000769 [termite gut metagenome]|uniref:DUF4943 domain-containing protein n=1 Tax=termite gut metagenome TaxID=433724 RepID=A0A5J4T2Z7_9ZZZZ